MEWFMGYLSTAPVAQLLAIPPAERLRLQRIAPETVWWPTGRVHLNVQSRCWMLSCAVPTQRALARGVFRHSGAFHAPEYAVIDNTAVPVAEWGNGVTAVKYIDRAFAAGVGTAEYAFERTRDTMEELLHDLARLSYPGSSDEDIAVMVASALLLTVEVGGGSVEE